MQIRHSTTDAVRATAGRPAAPGAGGSWWDRSGRGLARRLAEGYHVRRAARELVGLSARELRDIGLEHGAFRPAGMAIRTLP